jgi:hypothetical protein
MSHKKITLEVQSPAQEQLLRQYHAWLQELDDLAAQAPEGQVIDVLEEAVVTGGRKKLCSILEQAVQRRVDDSEKKGRRSAAVRVARRGKIAERPRDNW